MGIRDGLQGSLETQQPSHDYQSLCRQDIISHPALAFMSPSGHHLLFRWISPGPRKTTINGTVYYVRDFGRLHESRYPSAIEMN